jgi:ABC-type transport system involved in cytochrome c biogenesis permease subunit
MLDIALVIRGLLLIGALVYVAAWVLHLIRRVRVARLLLAGGWGVNLAVFVINWVVAGHPPFGSMYHVLVFLALCFPPLLALMGRCWAMGWAVAYVAFPAAISLMGAASMDPGVHWRRMPALQSPWFVPHVFSYMLSYALATVGFVMMVVKRVRRLGGESWGRYGTGAYRVLRLGFPLMTFGMLSGALWAEEAWGRYWSWDPKETWSLITWTLYLIYFHCRYLPKLSRWADLAQGMAFGALLRRFLLVNLMPRLSSVLHSYAG